jgi:taurine transport system ATP-binding protein
MNTIELEQPGHSDDPMIRLSDIRLIYNAESDNPFEALQNVNLEVATGEFVCVLGTSGCGKTSLLRLIAGFEKPSSGHITIGGKSHHKPDSEVGVVFQHHNLFPWLSVRQNIGFGLKMRGKSARQIKETVDYYLDLTGLTAFADTLPHQLSGGMKQRTAIARALAPDPKVILMDEPFGALDAMTREQMQESLIEIWEKTGKTLFFITHDVEECLLLSTRVLVMQPGPGRIVYSAAHPARTAGMPISTTEIRKNRNFMEWRESLTLTIRNR